MFKVLFAMELKSLNNVVKFGKTMPDRRRCCLKQIVDRWTKDDGHKRMTKAHLDPIVAGKLIITCTTPSHIVKILII